MFSSLVKGEGTWDGELELVEDDFEQSPLDSLFPSISKLQFGARADRLYNTKEYTEQEFIELPKTYLTRKGAIVLFSTSKEQRQNQYSKKSNEVCSCSDVFTKHSQKTEKLCPTCQIHNEPDQRKMIFSNLLEGIVKNPETITAHDQIEKNVSDGSFDNTKTRDMDVYNILSRPKTMCSLHRYKSANKQEKQRPKTVATCRPLPPEIEQAKAHPRITSAKPRPTTRVLGKLRYQNLISEFEEDVNIHSDTLEIHYPCSPINEELEQPRSSPIEQELSERSKSVDKNVVDDITTAQYSPLWMKDDVDHHGDEEQYLVDGSEYPYVTDSLDISDMIDSRSRAVSSLCGYSETDVSITTERPLTGYSEYQDGSIRSSGIFTSARPATALSGSRRGSKTPSELEQSYRRPLSQLTQDSGVNVEITNTQNYDESPHKPDEDLTSSDDQWATKRALSLLQSDIVQRTRVKSAPCSSKIKEKAWSLRTRSAGYRKQRERESNQISVSTSADVVRVPCASIFHDQRKQEDFEEDDVTPRSDDVSIEYQNIQTTESVCDSSSTFSEPEPDSLAKHGRSSSVGSIKSTTESITIEKQPTPPRSTCFSEDYSRSSSRAESLGSVQSRKSEQTCNTDLNKDVLSELGNTYCERLSEYDDSETRDKSKGVPSLDYPNKDEHVTCVTHTKVDIGYDTEKIVYGRPTSDLSDFEDKQEKEIDTIESRQESDDSLQQLFSFKDNNKFPNVSTQLQLDDNTTTKTKLRPKTAKPVRKTSLDQSREDSKDVGSFIKLDLVSSTPQRLEEKPTKTESVSSIARESLLKIEQPSKDGEHLDIQGVGKEDGEIIKVETTTTNSKINLLDLVKKNDDSKMKTPVVKSRKSKDTKKTRMVKMKEEKVEKLKVIPTIDEKLIEALESGEGNIELSDETLEKFAPIEKFEDTGPTMPEDGVKKGPLKTKQSSKKGKGRKKKDTTIDKTAEAKKKMLEEKQRHEKELELLKEREDEQTKIKEVVLERQRAVEDETARRMEQELEAKKKEEEAMLLLKEARRKAKEERDKRREEDAERRRRDNAQRRKEKKLRESEIRERELELEKQRVDRDRRRAELDARKERERELERIAEEQRREEERLRLLELDNEENLEDDLVREAEETLQRLAREREYREQMRKIAEAQKSKLEKQENERRLKEQQERAAIEAERKRIADERIARENEERERIRQLRHQEALARMKAAQEAAKRRAWALQRREQNIDRMTHLKSTRQAQKITGPYSFSYYPNIPKKVMELPYNWNSKKKRTFKPTSRKKKTNEQTA